MRNGFYSQLWIEEAKVIAVTLGADHCAEHEWGIKVIIKDFGLREYSDEDTVFGVERRSVTKIPSHLQWFEKHKRGGAGFISYRSYAENPKPVDYLSNDYLSCRDNKENLWGAWDEKSFAVGSHEKSVVEHLREIYHALTNDDGLIWLGGGGPFQNAGLCAGIKSRLPQEKAQQWADVDRENYEVKQEAKKTGIFERLQKAGRKYYALSPKRLHGELKFWLNPMQQDIYNAGWFTVEDLDRWIVGEGPVMQARKAKA